MKVEFRYMLFMLFLFTAGTVPAQFNQWTWMHGDNTASPPGVYGTQGIPAPANKPPGRYEAAQWKDLQGNFWLYGGGSAMTRYSDLWKYDPLTNQWTWMHGSTTINQPAVFGTQGVAAPGNTPGGMGFGAGTWTDLNGNLWLFGGEDGGSAYDNLWKYDPLTNMWTWMKGTGTPSPPAVHGTQGVAAAANTPGARCETACTWTDNAGNLWLFGGSAAGVGSTWNDLWKYDPLTNMWTWMKGSNTQGQSGVYGTMNVAAAANTPGARWCYTSWKDNAGNLWLFGGIDAMNNIFMGFYNDLWKYNIATNQWTWMSGSNTPNAPGVYGSQCVPAATNVPGGRGETRSCWTDSCGNFWLLGGRDMSFDVYNDLWRYTVATGMWTWISGNNTPNAPGVYGTVTVPAPGNRPGGRMGAVSWINSSGLWLFGGYDSGGGEFNDLWLYRPDTIAVAAVAQPLSGCASLTVQFNGSVQSGCGSVKTFSWNFGDPASGTADTSTAAAPTHVYNTAGTYTVTLLAFDCMGNADSSQLQVNVSPGFTLTGSATPATCLLAGGTASAGTTGGNGPFTYLWQPTGNTTASVNNLQAGSYTVTVTDVSGCSATDTVVVLLDTAGFAVHLGSDTTFCGAVNLLLDAGLTGANYNWSTGATTQTIAVNGAGTYWVQASAGLCQDGDTVQVDVVLPPAIGENGSFCEQPVVTLAAGNAQAGSYLWSTGDTTAAITVTQPGTYSVTVFSQHCSFTDSVTISEATGAGPWFPNAFTPNANDLNEIFIPKGEGITDYHLMIFNRWGELLFETTDFFQGWNGIYKGTLVQQDVYVWVADYRSACADNTLRRRTGHVSVIR